MNLGPEVKNKIAEWWLRNASIRHGHIPDNVMQETQATETPATAEKSLAAKLAPYALAAGGLAAGLTLPTWWDWFKGDTPAPTTEQTGSLYQHLEDGGYHVYE